MSVINSQPLIGASGQAGYNLTKSLRFRSSASAYLNRTPASATNRTTWTWSGWVKLGLLTPASGWNAIFGAYSDDNNRTFFYTNNNSVSNAFYFFNVTSGSTTCNLISTQLLRDPSAWYHLVVSIDTTQGTSTDRVKIYLNGSQITSFGTATYPSSSANFMVNNNVAHYIGASSFSGINLFHDGYMTEINFIDGQALTPSSFGETSTTTGVWIPKKYTGTYGTNGFYLPFTDTTSTSTLGTDFSGNSNTWTVNNISLTSGSTYDSMNDVPTNTSATVANYPVLSPIDNTGVTISNANLTATTPASNQACKATMSLPTTGKYYFEATDVVTGGGNIVGIANVTLPTNTSLYLGTGSIYVTMSSNAVFGLAFNFDALTYTIYKNNSVDSTGSITSEITYIPFMQTSASGGASTAFNFGQRPFAYTPPTGFVALNTFNLPTPTIGATASTQADDYFNAVLYSGNNSTQNIAVGFQPDWVWSKCRNVGRSHRLSDAVRGSTRDLYSDTTDAEQNDGSITSFISTGFSLNNATGSAYNTSGENYVSWAWKANGTGSSNTAGSITSTVSANTTAGFSIVTYTGNGTSGATIGHGLGVAPSMVIVKVRDVAAYEWNVYHSAIGATNFLELNATTASTAASNRWNNTAPTSSVFSVGNANVVNQNTKTYVAYCFAPVAGYSAFGSYTGNGSTDGTFVYTGFRPRFLMLKRTDSTGDWFILDTARDTYNVAGNVLYPNLSIAESGVVWFNDILSNGFKLRITGANQNANGGTYIYAAFAESPFKYANAR